MRRFIFSLLSIIALVGLLSCQGLEPSDTVIYQGALVRASSTDLPDASTVEGQLFYVIDESEFYYSDGSTFILIDLSGPIWN